MKKIIVELIIILPILIGISKSRAQDSLFVKKDTITIIGVGDIMLGTNYPSHVYLPYNKDCAPLMKEVIPILKTADITFGNLECCISDSAPLSKKCSDSTKCYAFRMPDKFSHCLYDAGFDLLSLANNHSGDFGSEGRNNTMRLLDSLNIGYAGLITNPTYITEHDSVKYGFVAFAPNKGTLGITNYKLVEKLVKELDKESDIVIVSFHGGAEGAKYQHVTKSQETFYGENRGNVYEFARIAIDAGADVVFGHGPHVTRAIDLYKNRFIIYSLGNFCTWGRFNLRGPNGIAPIIELKTTLEGEFISGKIHSVYQDGKNGTKIDEQKQIISKLQYLTNQDFPDSPLLITNEGDIKLK